MYHSFWPFIVQKYSRNINNIFNNIQEMFKKYKTIIQELSQGNVLFILALFLLIKQKQLNIHCNYWRWLLWLFSFKKSWNIKIYSRNIPRKGIIHSGSFPSKKSRNIKIKKYPKERYYSLWTFFFLQPWPLPRNWSISQNVIEADHTDPKCSSLPRKYWNVQ